MIHTYVFSIYFGDAPILPTVVETYQWRCTYVQYQHDMFYYGE